MNYILTLQAKLATSEAQLQAISDEMRRMSIHLASSKFQGVDYRTGEFNDYINVRDVQAFISRLQAASFVSSFESEA